MHDCYCCSSQYCYYSSRSQAKSLIFLRHSLNLHFRWQAQYLYSSISLVKRPNFKVIMSHLHKIGLLAYSYIRQTIFSIISSEHSSLIFSSSQTADALREVLFFEVGSKHKDWFKVSYNFMIFACDRNPLMSQIDFYFGKDCSFHFVTLQ